MRGLYATGNFYIAVPQALVHMEEDFTEMSGKEFVLLVWLSHQADRYTNRRRYSNKSIADAIKIHENRVRWLRNKLVARGLLKVEKESDGIYYVLTNPTTARPVDERNLVKENDDDWGQDSVLTSPVPIAAPEVESRPMTVDELEQRYNSYKFKSQEEIEIGEMLPKSRKDPARNADLKERRAALELERARRREAARIEYEAALTHL